MRKIVLLLLMFQVACHEGANNKTIENKPIPVNRDSIDTESMKYPLRQGVNVDSLGNKKMSDKNDK